MTDTPTPEPTPEEWRIAWEHAPDNAYRIGDETARHIAHALARYRARLERLRNEVLEEAAAVCDGEGEAFHGMAVLDFPEDGDKTALRLAEARGADTCARRIRALKHTEDASDG